MATIWPADNFGLPVSTTHVLSSGVAGTMAANKSGLQMSTIRNIALAWVFTLPAAALLSGCLFWLFNNIAPCSRPAPAGLLRLRLHHPPSRVQVGILNLHPHEP